VVKDFDDTIGKIDGKNMAIVSLNAICIALFAERFSDAVILPKLATKLMAKYGKMSREIYAG
jgi:hypothetical protein